MLDQRRAAEIVDRINLRALPICHLCHLELAFAIVDAKPPRVLAGKVTGTCSWVWPEIRVELLAHLRRRTMKGDAWAKEALLELEERKSRSRIVREIVSRVATEMAKEIRASTLTPEPRPAVLTFPLDRNT